MEAGTGEKNRADMAKLLKQAFAIMTQVDERDRRFVIGLQTKARLKVAATLYAQGLS